MEKPAAHLPECRWDCCRPDCCRPRKREPQQDTSALRQAKQEHPPPPKRPRQVTSLGHSVLGKASSPVRKSEVFPPRSDDSSDLGSKQAPLPKRGQRMQPRSKKHWRRGADGARGGPSVLEDSAVQPRTQRRYEEMVELFMSFCRSKGLPTGDQEEADAAMVQFLHHRFFSGYMASDGVYRVVGWMALHPSYGRHGPLSLVRSHRALKGWRSLEPPCSLIGVTIFVVSAVAAELIRRPRPDMAAWTMTAHLCYLRPSSNMALRRTCLVAPKACACDFWSASQQLRVQPDVEDRDDRRRGTAGARNTAR